MWKMSLWARVVRDCCWAVELGFFLYLKFTNRRVENAGGARKRRAD